MAPSAAGSNPRGTGGEQQAARWVRQMFSGIAPKYDLLNHLLSFNIDRSWRKALLESLQPVLSRSDARVLDLCCGTGDVMLDLQKVAQAQIMGADFCHPMLIAAGQKARRKKLPALLFEADALELPVQQNAFDGIAIAFGFRNLSNYRAGLSELHRVLKPGGVLAILEFSHPPGAFTRAAYGFYSSAILPLVGGSLSGSRAAYSYLPASIQNFPHANELKSMLEEAAYIQCSFQFLTGGIAALHTAQKHG